MTISLLPIISQADRFPYCPTGIAEGYIPFHLTLSDFQNDLPPIGLLCHDVVKEMRAVAEGIWKFEEDKETAQVRCVYFTESLVAKGGEEIGREGGRVVKLWKECGKFWGRLSGWRDECYAVYASSKSSGLIASSDPGIYGNVIFNLERSACPLFGVATFGVRMTAYEGEGENMKIWVPTRSKTKSTWPGKLDNSVSGGISAGSTPFETLLKECDEEASLPGAFIERYVKNAGVTTYFYITDEGFLQPEVSYVYDLPLPPSDSAEYIKLKPNDDEVESFSLLTIPEVIEALHADRFKPNCGLILVDFLIRHGFVTPETEPNLLEISSRMRKRLRVALPGV
ncbi:hypothetical protein I302_103500 [Kwoniella bestiolae CBS 10118]|uniref:Nudix hydrolase domain-containing protein n=1 Tax=Kwoniella bestiolae CBS 10118 TaxID=1296100 RepID=A0A1B9G8N6_9TREE|nr:hypothetical protein I302_02202 [Kwoniella bestiolae CBS 10118]OCF27361.1 hypothetical protein I302_02202 [Kwoniella bestiolae CBS 10118]